MLVMNAMDVMDDPRVYRQATTMAQAGYNVVVIGRSLSANDPPREHSHGVTVIRVRNLLPKLFIAREKALNLLKEGEFLIRALIANLQMAVKAIRLGVDIYHAHEIGALPVGYTLKHLTGAKLVYDAHELYTESSSMQRASRWFRGLFEAVQSYILPKVDGITTVGETMAQEMYRRYKCSRPVIVRNCPRWEQTDATQRNALRRALGLTEDQKIVLFQGAYAPYRGLEQIVESTKFLREDGVIVLRGWGEMENELRALAQGLRVSDRIFFVEPVAAREVVNAAIGADIGVMAYLPDLLNYKYASPNKVFEYMMAGLAIAASDLPEIRGIIEETGSGVLFDPYDPKSIASAINKLISDEELLRSAQRNARRAAREKYNWEKESQKLLSLYETLLADG